MNTTSEAATAATRARNNRTVLLAHFIDVLVMTTFCFLQVFSGLATWSYVLIVALLGFVPVAIEHLLWKRNPQTRAIKHLVAICFAVFYTFTLFTSSNQLVFVFVIPMILIVSVYNDVRYSLLINIGTVTESLIIAIVGGATGKFGYLGMDYGIIQVVFMILVGIYSLFTAKTLNTNFEEVLAGLSSVSEEMKSGIQDIHAELVTLNDASASTISAMQEVSTGTNDTAEAVQNQLLQTQSIQSKTEEVYDSINHISENMQNTLAALYAGNQDVASLVEKVAVSVENSVAVAEKLKTLDQSIVEMNSITGLIGSIARQTGLLALNARIEASHAGEFGKGFAVVATEISEMSTQTNDATTHIAELIEHISTGIADVVTVIYQMIEGINEEKQSTEHTSESFDSIQRSTLSIRDHLEQLIQNIEELKDANGVIADSVQTISAVSEEVSAHAAETVTAEEQNEAILERIDTRMQELLDLITE